MSSRLDGRFDERVVSALRSVSRGSFALVVVTGLLVLAGWAFDISVFKSVLPGLVTMKANTAAAFVLAGLALGLLWDEEAQRGRRLAAQAMALVVALVGLATLAEYVFGWDLGIDQLLFKEPWGAVQTFAPGRMAPATAACFLLLGSALLLLGGRRAYWLTQSLTLAAHLISVVTLLGYLFNAGMLYGAGPYTTIALHTSFAFFVLSEGILFSRPSCGLMAIVSSDSAGGVMARRLLPAALGVPVVLTWFRLLGQQARLYESEFGLLLLVVSLVLVLVVLIWVIARSLTAMDARRKAAESRFANILDIAADGIIAIDEDHRITLFNQAAERIFGYDAGEVVGRPLDLLLPARIAEGHRDHVNRFRDEAVNARRMGERREIFGRRKDGSEFPAEASISKSDPQEPATFTVILRDVTEQKRAQEKRRRHAAELERSNKALEDFAYIASHDLQEPLRKIQAFGGRLKVKCGSVAPDALEDLGRMESAAARMQTLIDDLLEYSRVATTPQPLVTVDLSETAREAVSDLCLRIEQTGGRVFIGDMPAIEAVRSQMRQLIGNLIWNALKFRRPDAIPLVNVYGQVTNGDALCQLFVEDNGIGFDEKYLDRIFQPFQRLHGRSEYEGTGIGLAICRRIVERHGGTITAKSAQGLGATFIVTLPTTQSKEDKAA